MIDPQLVIDARKTKADFFAFIRQRNRDKSKDAYVIALLARLGVRHGAMAMLATMTILPDQVANLIGVFKGFGTWPDKELQRFIRDPQMAEFTVPQLRELGKQCLKPSEEAFMQVGSELLAALD